ncbi:MAG: hypothetical protein IPN07_16510 [Dehalococcoidia bacterium]|nr:hypothetical protein [Dehalococcoidia bacterium]
MAGWKLKAALLFLWPAVGLAWLAWIATRAALARNATGTFALVSVAGFSVGGGAPAYVETSAPIVRAVVLAPFTGPAVAWGLAHGGEIHCQGSMIVITGMSGGHGPRSAVTVGQVILTSRVALDDPSSRMRPCTATSGRSWESLRPALLPLRPDCWRLRTQHLRSGRRP